MSACWSARNNGPSSKWWSGHILDHLITTAKGCPSFANPRLGELDRHSRRLTTTDAINASASALMTISLTDSLT